VLTLPRLAWVAPTRLQDALDLLSVNKTRAAGDGDVAARRGPVIPVAGGTDIVPNLKHRLLEAETLVSLQRLREPFLRGVRVEEDGVRIGALTAVADAAADPLLQAAHPALARAYSLVASPQLRNMGTVGGNLCLDTRCTYYNQTPFWRQALGYCLKREGTRCHVVPGGTRCVAAHSSDGATMLLALGAEARVAGPGGERWLGVEDLFLGEGRRNLKIGPEELVLEVRIARPAPGQTAAYQKLRPRAAIDFPALSVAVVARREPDGTVRELRVVVAALGAKPRLVAGLDRLAAGRRADGDLVRQVGETAAKQCHPLTNIPIDTEWRHAMVPVYVRRALADALGDGAGASPTGGVP
jgi:4-hydroxybenzoyl-CoA reductase subunit beta